MIYYGHIIYMTFNREHEEREKPQFWFPPSIFITNERQEWVFETKRMDERGEKQHGLIYLNAMHCKYAIAINTAYLILECAISHVDNIE
jgi:hypothetical protein